MSERTKGALAAKKASGAKLGNRSNIAAAGLCGRQIQIGAADQFATGLLPVIDAIRRTGATTLEAITCAQRPWHSARARYALVRVVGSQPSQPREQTRRSSVTDSSFFCRREIAAAAPDGQRWPISVTSPPTCRLHTPANGSATLSARPQSATAADHAVIDRHLKTGSIAMMQTADSRQSGPLNDALDRHAALCRADKDDGLESGRIGCQRGNRGTGGTALSKVRFLSVVSAKLRTEVVAARRPPKFNITIA